MAKGQQTNAPISAELNVDLALSSFDNFLQHTPQEAREFDYNLLTEGVALDRNSITQSLGLNRNYCTPMQSYMIGTGEATPLDEYSAKVRQDAFDLGLRVVLETKNAFVAQLAPRVSAIFGSENLADPRDIGIDRGSFDTGLDHSEATIANFSRIRAGRNKFIESLGLAQAA